MLNWYLVKILKDSCGDYGCTTTTIKKLVAAKNEENAVELIDDKYDISEFEYDLMNVEKFEIPNIQNISNPTIII